MREIKFRGVSKVHHNMIFGDLVQNDPSTGKYIKVGIKERGCVNHEVEPETIGQMFLIDGVEIYEGDLIKEGENTYVTIFLEGCLSLCNILSPTVFVKPVNRDTLRHSEIIGNIHTPTDA